MWRKLGLALAALALFAVGYSADADQGPYSAQVQRALSASQQYGEMYLYDNATATTNATNAVYTAVRNFTTGAVLKGFTFYAGSTGPISAFANYGGTVAGTVLVTDTAHGLTTGDVVTITGTTSYNGTFAITKVSDDTFYITDTWVANDATGNWFLGSYIQTSSPGVYLVTLAVTLQGASATVENYHVEANKGITALDNVAMEVTLSATGNTNSLASSGFVRLAAGDRLWVSIKQVSAGTDSVTFNHGNLNAVRIGD